jgi:hypothetical protein
LDVSRLIDLWSIMQVPLHVTLACPSSLEPDPLANPDHEVDPHLWPEPASELRQAKWLDQFLPLLMAKPAVASVTWSTFTDALPHEFPHAGLLRIDGHPKSSLETIINYQRAANK